MQGVLCHAFVKMCNITNTTKPLTTQKGEVSNAYTAKNAADAHAIISKKFFIIQTAWEM